MSVTLIRPPDEISRSAGYRVIWLGDRPWWLDTPAARKELADVEPGPPSRDPSRPFVVHATAPVLRTLQHASHERLVADLSGCTRLDRVGAKVARAASVVVADDPERLQILGRSPVPAWSLQPEPVDLDAYAPRDLLQEHRDRELKRFRRLHRLTARTVLYAGPYRRADGWLDTLLAAAMLLRARYDDLVVLAIPDGGVERRYLDACERQALALGHRATIAWAVDPGDRALCYALASVACVGPATFTPTAPVLLSAAAALPALAVGGDGFQSLPAELLPDDVPAGDPQALAERIEALLDDTDTARALGEARRREIESHLSPGAAARRLRILWSELAESR